MYCSHCGKQMDDTARFCPACGAALPMGFARGPFPGQLTRPHYHRMIAGVCAGLALHYGWDLSLVRLIAVLALFLSGGTAMLAYFAAWIIIPDAPYVLPEQGTATSPSGSPGAGI
jgi:phage shock protein C